MIALQPWIITFLLLSGPRPFGMGPASGPARLAFKPSQATNFTLEGKVTQHSAGKLTVSTEQNIVFHVRYDEKTVIKRQDGSRGSAKEIHRGSRVSVEGDLTASGEIIAQKIELRQDSDSKRH